jgi:alkylated DNA nucleotide flippase Atl1
VLVFIVLEKILAHLGADVLEQESQVPKQRVVSQDGVTSLREVAQTPQEQQRKYRRQPR